MNNLSSQASHSTTASLAHCPICAKTTEPTHKPFCSTRCATIDLGRWLGEDYRVCTDDRPSLSDADTPTV